MSLSDAMEILDGAGLGVAIHDKDLRELRVTDGRGAAVVLCVPLHVERAEIIASAWRGLEERVDLARGQRLTLRALDALAQHWGV